MISACEWIFAGRPLALTANLLVRAGCEGVEVSGEPSRDDLAELHDCLDRSELKATGVTPLCRWPTDERDLAHPAAAARKRAVDYYRRCVDLASVVGAPAIGLIPVAVGRVAPIGDPATEWSDAVRGATEVAEYAGERGVSVGIEAVNRYESYLVSTAEQALTFAHEIGLPNVGVILDLFHMNIEESDVSQATTTAVATGDLIALHVADSNRRAPGAGHADIMNPVKSALSQGFNGPIVLECTAPGPDPFTADKGSQAMAILDDDIVNGTRILMETLNGG